ncbi:MAG: alanine--tRNA ligase [Gloeomargaritaceae cyanobacterium C42_A2020_066]|nr:alanine--tRNA ligase [Gloeomargaritaceae cyanobacterium C42_A2020_066]
MLPFLSGDQIRQRFLDFFIQKGHQLLPSASLVPEDPTVLLTIAGMLPFKPIFLGQRPAAYPRVTTAQRCLRTNDIENVGRTARHHTFFEMLGNFSFGDYFKKEAIRWAWELVTEVYQVPAECLAVSVFREDDEAYHLWRDEVGVPAARIQRLGEEDNFWAAGPTGPCGPCSEIYFDFHPERRTKKLDLGDDRRFLEIYNLVFMELNRDGTGHCTPLAARNIDTGMGLERMAQVLQGVPNNYETDLIFPIIQRAAGLGKLDYAQADASTQTALKVIGDHTRAVVQLLADGVRVSNLGRGYILRRLIRRVVRYGRLLGLPVGFTGPVAETAIDLAKAVYPPVGEQAALIQQELLQEEERFLKTLERGEKLLVEILGRPATQATQVIPGNEAFVLYDTYGFPLELTEEVAAEQGLTVDRAGFEAAMAEQVKRSQAAHETVDVTAQQSLEQLVVQLPATQFVGYDQTQVTAEVLGLFTAAGLDDGQVTAGRPVQVMLDQTPFYAESGGQVGDQGYLLGPDLVVRITDVQKHGEVFVHIGQVERGSLGVGDRVTAQIDRVSRRRAAVHHTATHLLQAALRKLVDEQIGQAGSLVAGHRLRFDFTYAQALTPDQVQQVEAQINAWIAEAHSTEVAVMSLTEAKRQGAVAMFGEKYGDQVRVVDVPGVSMELCGGTHISNTAEIGLFKILSETGVASGIRRIEAVAGPAVLDYLNQRDGVVRDLGDLLKAKPEDIPDRVRSLQGEVKTLQKEVDQLQAQLARQQALALLSQAETVGTLQVLVAQLGQVEPEALKTAAQDLLQKLGAGAVILGSAPATDRVALVATFSPEVVAAGLQAGRVIGEIAKQCGGGGGGRPNLAQAGGRDPSQLPQALAAARQTLLEQLGVS